METDSAIDKIKIAQKHSMYMKRLLLSLPTLIKLKIENEVALEEPKLVIFCSDFLPYANPLKPAGEFFNKLSRKRLGEVYDEIHRILDENNYQFYDFGDYSFIVRIPEEN